MTMDWATTFVAERTHNMSEKDWVAAVAKNLDDWERRLVYSDWLEEHERHDEAFAQRWMASRQVRPANRITDYHGFAVCPQYSWAWWTEKLFVEGSYQHASRDREIKGNGELPFCVSRFIKCGGINYGGWHYITFPTCQEAEAELTRVLTMLRETLAL